jgi:hypothetical protein
MRAVAAPLNGMAGLVDFRQASADRASSEAIPSYQIEPTRHKMKGERLLQGRVDNRWTICGDWSNFKLLHG